MKPLNEQQKKRFWSRVIKTDSCWLWDGSAANNGYGQVWFNGKNYLPHRVSLTIAGEKLNPKLCVDHICKNRMCVNPNHLRQVTNQTNATENSESFAAKNKLKTHCSKGHPLSGDNVRIYNKPTSDGLSICVKRYCKTCIRDYCRQWKERKKLEKEGGESECHN